jgi:pimeloyl-ACP methyl ester carboxylesterase
VPFEVEHRPSPIGWRMFAPKGVERAPIVMLLHGSDGAHSGWAYLQAYALAAHGFIAAPFGYSINGNAWHAGDILEVELEKTATALGVLRTLEGGNGKVGLYGVSRGAEHALVLASLMAQHPKHTTMLPDAIAVHSPSDTIVGAFIGGAWSPKEAETWDPSQRAWCWKGSSNALLPTTPIEIEHFVGPIQISHGEADEVWTVDCTRRLEARLRAAGRFPEVYYYPGCGHGLKPEAENLAQQRLMSFLSKHLGNQPSLQVLTEQQTGLGGQPLTCQPEDNADGPLACSELADVRRFPRRMPHMQNADGIVVNCVVDAVLVTRGLQHAEAGPLGFNAKLWESL